MSFNTDDWSRRIEALKPINGDSLDGRPVIGPCDACIIEKLRKMLVPYIDTGNPYPTDLFVLSIGSGRQDSTKIGGLPFWPLNRSWPTGAFGQELPFFAQFNFCQSLDIVPALPGDMLLLFGDPSIPDEFALEWVFVSEATSPIDLSSSRVKSIKYPLFGNIWRTQCYPQWLPLDGESWSDVLLEDGSWIHSIYLVFQYLGMQIGSSPFVPAGVKVAATGEEVICSISSICPREGQPYPFLNRADSLNPAEVDSYSVNLCRSDDDEGFGVLYVIRDSVGSFRCKYIVL